MAGVGVCMWTDIDRLQGKVVWTPPSPADKSCTEKETRPVVHAKNSSQQIRTLLLKIVDNIVYLNIQNIYLQISVG